MARYFTVYQSPTRAMEQAFRESTRLGKSQTVYVPVGTDEPFYMVGDTSAAEDMKAAGAIPLVSLQSHTPPCFRMEETMACWADLEEEAARG